mgnify:CR=1 FL=1|jgi:hypothetical protein
MDDGMSDIHARGIQKYKNILALPGPAEFWP